MVRMFALALASTAHCRVRQPCGCRQSWRPGNFGCRRGAGRSRAPASIWHFRLRRRWHGSQRHAGRRLLRLRQRHLDQEHAIPADKSQLRHVQCSGRSLQRADAHDHRCRAVQGPEQPDRQRLRSLHGSGCDRGEGPRPDPALAEPDQRRPSRKAGLAALYAKADRIGVNIPFRMFVGQDRKASDRYTLNVSQGGLGMPDRDYYLSADPKLVETRSKYLDHLPTC